MDAYKEFTCSNQAREDDALFAGIEVYTMVKTPHDMKVG